MFLGCNEIIKCNALFSLNQENIIIKLTGGQSDMPVNILNRSVTHYVTTFSVATRGFSESVLDNLLFNLYQATLI